jgi:hypothetical protein
MYVECRKNFSAKKFWVSVCALGAVWVSVWCFLVCFSGSEVRFYVG